MIAIHPPDAKAPPKNKKQKQNVTAVSDTAPSIERSIDPIKIMKVTPTATIKNGDAAIAILAKFLNEKKLEFMDVKKITNTNKTIIGISD